MVPIVSSARAKIDASGSNIDVELARELLLFNFLGWLCLVPIAVLAFVYYGRWFGYYRIRKIREKGPLPQLLAGGVILIVMAMVIVGPLKARVGC